jgi:hypothetical protein
MNYLNKIDEYDKIITGINQEITYDKFPILFDYLIKTKQLSQNQPFLHFNLKKVYTPIIIKNLEERNDIKNTGNYEQKNKEKEKLETMSKEDLIQYILKINKKKNEELNINEENKEEENKEENKDEVIKELKKKLKHLNNQLDEQIKKNNYHEVIIGVQNRKIDRLQKESLILNNNFRNKKQSTTLLTPNRSTLYNSTGIEYNSNISENITNRKTNFNKSIKKSNSCLQINKIEYKRPISHKIKKYSEIKTDRNCIINKHLPKEFSSKLREFQMDRENNIINSVQNKK